MDKSTIIDIFSELCDGIVEICIEDKDMSCSTLFKIGQQVGIAAGRFLSIEEANHIVNKAAAKRFASVAEAVNERLKQQNSEDEKEDEYA